MEGSYLETPGAHASHRGGRASLALGLALALPLPCAKTSVLPPGVSALGVAGIHANA